MNPVVIESAPAATLPAAEAAAGDRRWRLAAAGVVLLSAAIAFGFRGHFVKPQSDFFEFARTGQQMLAGERPRTFKRAPLYPLIVASGGWVLRGVAGGESPEQTFAEWFNACIAPLNTLLVLLIARRWMSPAAAVTVAAWSALIPLAAWCGANAIVEAPLVGTILLTIWLAQRGSGWAYFAAMLATALRYDAAGLLAGLVIWDLLRTASPVRVALQALAATTPMGVWLLLTWLYWNPADGEHYLAQIRNRPSVSAGHALWALQVTLAAILQPLQLTLPAFAAGWADPVEAAGRWALYAAALCGGAALLWRCDRGAAALLACYLGYTAVHVVFPFEEYRFGYPLAPLAVIAAGVGAARVVGVLGSVAVLRPAWFIGGGLLVLVCGLGIVAEALDVRAAAGAAGARATRLTALVCGGLLVFWLIPRWRRGRLRSRLAVLLAIMLAGRLHARETAAMMGSGLEMANVVAAARWVRDHATPADRVLSTVPGLLQLYAGVEPRGRFVELQRIRGETWPQILRELRLAGITYIVWHDAVFSEAGGYYIDAWGLRRFEPLNDPAFAPGIWIEKIIPAEQERGPNVWILRVKGVGRDAGS